MPLSAKIHIWPKEIAAEINDRGNVWIMGIDRDTGTEVVIEVHSSAWKSFLNKMNRMHGVGIVKPKSEIAVPDEGKERLH